jgi:hypothetical protein
MVRPWPAVVVLRVFWILLHDGIDGVFTRVGKDGVEKECEYKPSSVNLCLGLETWTCAIAWAGIRLLLKAGDGWEEGSYPGRLVYFSRAGSRDCETSCTSYMYI